MEEIESRRDALEAALDQLQEPSEEIVEKIQEPEETIVEEVEEEPQVERDENGRFVAKDEVEVEETPEEIVEEVKKPTTWKKEYVDVWEKMKEGKPLDKEEFVKFAEYANQREAEYKRGVSAYKAEADNARQLTEAIGPFIPELQAQNIHPVAWINNLGRAHMVLSKAPHQEKVQMFHRLAQDYGIQLNQNGIQMPEQQYVDPYQQQLMQQLQATQQQVQQLSAIREQEENARLNQEISRVSSDRERFPHFEMVREDMAQLLERGLAQDLESAYAKAVRMNDEAYKLETEKLLKTTNMQASKAQQVAKAKATAVSPRSSTPSGQVSKGDAKDRRSLIAEQLGQAMDGRV
jgi:hypothetical protein